MLPILVWAVNASRGLEWKALLGLVQTILFLVVLVVFRPRAMLLMSALSHNSTQTRPIPVLGIPVFYNADLLLRLLSSIDYPVDHVVIVQNGRHPAVTKVVLQLRKEHPSWIILQNPDNVGVAGAWNRIIEAVPDARYHVISNDDIAFQPGALHTMAHFVEEQGKLVAARQSNNVILYASRNWPFSMFAILPHAVQHVGKFDENFWPAYFEDADYKLRLARAGLWLTEVPKMETLHGHSKNYKSGSSVKVMRESKVAENNEYAAQQLRAESSMPYFALKWVRPGVFPSWQWLQRCVSGLGTASLDQDCTRRCIHPMYVGYYQHPFNDSSLHLSFVLHDGMLRQCVRNGSTTGRPCRYNHTLLNNPDLVPQQLFEGTKWIDHVFERKPKPEMTQGVLPKRLNAKKKKK